ncbi:MAG: hypothetical protein Q4F07_08945 [Bacteroidales bacterium]|nr:hypothetical protein [Bacteroidales bacterium]
MILFQSKTAIRHLSFGVAILVSLLMTGCRGCADGNTEEHKDHTEEESVNIILSQPQVFDAQSIDELAAKIRAGGDITSENVANMIVLAEATSNKVEMEVENLMRVDDPADTYHTLHGFADAQWYIDYRTIYDFLQSATLSDEFASRVGTLKAANSRLDILVTELEKKHLKGENVLDF